MFKGKNSIFQKTRSVAFRKNNLVQNETVKVTLKVFFFLSFAAKKERRREDQKDL